MIDIASFFIGVAVLFAIIMLGPLLRCQVQKDGEERAKKWMKKIKEEEQKSQRDPNE